MPETPTTPRRWLTQAEAAEYLSTTDRTVRRMIADGSLPAHRLGKRMIRIDRADVDALMRPIPTAGGAA